MSHEVEPSRQSGSNAYINSQTTRYGANGSDWIQEAGTTLIADESPQISGTALPLGGFNATHATTSLTVTIATGEGFVGGAYIATDQTHDIALAAGTTNQEVYVGWDYNATNTVQVGTAAVFEPKDPKLLIWSFNTDAAGVKKATDHRPIGFSAGTGGSGSGIPNTGIRIVGPGAGHYSQIQDAIDATTSDHGEIFIHPDWAGEATETWPVECGTEKIWGAGPNSTHINVGDPSTKAFIFNAAGEGGQMGPTVRDLRITHAHTALTFEGLYNARVDNVKINNCERGIHTYHGGGSLRPDSFSHVYSNVRIRGFDYGGRHAFEFDTDSHSMLLLGCDALDHLSGVDAFGSTGIGMYGCSLQLNRHYGAYIQNCRNLTIDNTYIEGNGTEGPEYAGVLLDSVYGGRISNCYFNGFNYMAHGVNTNTFRGPKRVKIENCVYTDLTDGFININPGADIPAADVDVMRHTHYALDDTPFWNQGSRATGNRGTRTRSNGVILAGPLDSTRGQYVGDMMMSDGTDTGAQHGDIALWTGNHWRVQNYDITITPA